MRLEGKTALITGAGSGFGAGIAKRFANEGASVALLDIDHAAATRVASDISGDTLALGADVASMAAMRSAVDAALDRWNGIDIVVNNAGISHRNKPMLEVDEAEFDRVMAVNVKSIFTMAHAILPSMKQRRSGSIINISSTASLRPRPNLTWYNGSKGAVTVISKSMAVELAPDNIRVNAIAPVMGATGLLETFMGVPDTEANRAKFVATIPLGRMSTPADIAGAALYLASDDAAFITGTILEVDGGRCI